MKKLLVLPLLLALTGCATTNTPSQETFTDYGRPIGNHYMPRNARQAQETGIQNWTARGSIAIRTPQKGFNANFNWEQHYDAYLITLFGPLGANRVQLSGNAQQVTLQNGNRVVSAPDAESLLQQQLGWSVPVSNLYYWMRGMPVPGSKGHRSYDMNNHLVQLDQQGWHIAYLRYVSVDGVDMPNRIVLRNPRVEVRVVVSNWNLQG